VSKVVGARRFSLSDLIDQRNRLWPAVVMIGLVGGLVGAAYIEALRGLRYYLWPTHHPHWQQWLLLLAVGAVIAVLVQLIGEPGDTELLVDNIHMSGGAEDTRSLWSLVPVSLLGIAVGGGIGPEAPLTQTTGTLGSWLGRRFGFSREDLRVCTITGMAAGFTVLFGAPLASAVFALEILHRKGLEYYEALVPAVVGSAAGYVVFTACTRLGLQPVWRFPVPPEHLHFADFGWSLVCGVAGAAVAVIFTYTSLAFRWLFRSLPAMGKPIAGAALLGLMPFVSPYSLTFSEDQLGHFAALPKVAIATLLLAALGHVLSASISMAGQWKGGFIIPLFFIGYCLGRVGAFYLPGANVVVLTTAMMVACNVGVTKTPLGSTLVVAELAGIRMLPTLVLAAMVSLWLTSNVGLIHSQRRRDSVEGEELSS
jgi:H+/Cl- antiporter ClcA